MDDDLLTWLRAQLDAREAKAKAADVKQGDPQWFVSPVAASSPRHFTVRSLEDKRPIAHVEDLAGDDEADAQGILDGAAVAAHIADNDPAFVLADVEAKRQIIDHVEEQLIPPGDVAEELVDTVEERADGYRSVLRLLALPFAGRPGWREEWRA